MQYKLFHHQQGGFINLKSCAIIEHFQDLPDPRIDRQKLHKLLDIIVISVCAIICGAKGFEEIELFGNERMQWLKQFIELKNGIPSHDTFGRVFALLNPKVFQERFMAWVEQIRLPKQSEVIAIDGKTARRSFDTKADRSAIHVVSAWATENRLVLGQLKVNDKSNEITAIPELLNMLMVKGCIVTIDAMGCQKVIAENIITNGADYVLAVKENQPMLYEQISTRVTAAADKGFTDISHNMFSTHDKGHGREEYREYHVIDDIACLENKNQWPSLSAVGAACSIRQTKNGEQTETRYYILSRVMSAKEFGNAVRLHWGIENRLHWNLDVSFREDECRIRKSNAPTNMNVVRHVAINLLKHETSIKVGIAPKQLKAALSTKYLERVLGIA
jgi:predicted transposase YbfD/YdcC